MSPPMSSRVSASLAQANLAYLRQGSDLIRRLTDEQYAATTVNGRRAGVGAHFRHVFDHYRSFLDGLERGRVDYDRRDRDLQVEHERAAALATCTELAERLERAALADATRPLDVLVDCGEPGTRVVSHSTFARELQFLVSHTVHHYAVIALLLRARGVEPGQDFGVAPSTLKFEQGNAACAR
jgi:uncharacterized damage-inducible protein DinB